MSNKNDVILKALLAFVLGFIFTIVFYGISLAVSTVFYNCKCDCDTSPVFEESTLPGMVYNADGTPCISAYEAAETTQEVQPIETPSEKQGPRYALTEAERDVVERVVMAESGAEPYEGQVLIAQCILNAAEKEGIRPDEAVIEYRYTPNRPDPSESVKRAVSAVFDDGEQVTAEPVLYFYAPAIVYSAFHEGQNFVIEVGGHRFFSEV